MNIVLQMIVAALPMLLIGCDQPAHNDPQSLAGVSQVQINQIAESLQVKYTIVDNWPDEQCDPDKAGGNCFQAKIELTAKQKVKVNDWEIYFSHTAPVQRVDSEEFLIEHVNGDLHRIKPAESYRGFTAGETKAIVFRASFWHVSESDPMPNYYLSVEGLEPQVIVSTRTQIDPETGVELHPYVSEITDADHQFRRSANDRMVWARSDVLHKANKIDKVSATQLKAVIIPTPKSIVVNPTQAVLDLSKGIFVTEKSIDESILSVALQRLRSLGIAQSESGIPVVITIFSDKTTKAEAYSLEISANQIEIVAVDQAGAFYALQSLAALIQPGGAIVPLLKVNDEPRYAFRGMHIDVARNFHSKKFLLKLLDQMAAYKLNKLHLHLADDEGWRIEIKDLPELTEIGSKRCHDLEENQCLLPQLGSGPYADASVNGFYSAADYIEIVHAAQARQIQVIPSLDMPSHARAAVKAMEARYRKLIDKNPQEAKRYLLSDFEDTTQYESVQFYSDNTINVCMESSYTFIEKLINEMKQLHEKAGQPLTRYHIGADETAGAWRESPVCKTLIAVNKKNINDVSELNAYFIERVSAILTKNNIEAAAWNDGLMNTRTENMPPVVQANAWGTLFWDGHRAAHELANRGWEVVISPPDVTYFDFPYEADPKEPGYYWGSRQTNTRKMFSFMPDNLPVHAEFWQDREGNDIQLSDVVERDQDGKLTYQPLQKGKRFAGIQGHLWSETVRSDAQAEYMIFPRLLALAERAWHQAEWEVSYNFQGAVYSKKSTAFTQEKRKQQNLDWQRFANTLGHKELLKLDRAGIFYRVPTVGAVIQNDKLHANIIFPGLKIEYRVDNGEWQFYENPVPVANVRIEIRARSANGQRSGRSLFLVK